MVLTGAIADLTASDEVTMIGFTDDADLERPGRAWPGVGSRPSEPATCSG